MDSVFDVIENSSPKSAASSAPDSNTSSGDGRVAAAVLRKFAKMLSEAEKRKREISEDIKAIKTQGKASGINVKVFTKVVKMVDEAAVEKARVEDDLREIYVEILMGGSASRSRH